MAGIPFVEAVLEECTNIAIAGNLGLALEDDHGEDQNCLGIVGSIDNLVDEGSVGVKEAVGDGATWEIVVLRKVLGEALEVTLPFHVCLGREAAMEVAAIVPMDMVTIP